MREDPAATPGGSVCYTGSRPAPCTRAKVAGTQLGQQQMVPHTTQWDADGNGEITDLEFRRGLWNAWDLDGDEVVDIYEYRGQQGS